MIQRFTTSLKIGNLVKKLKLTQRTRALTGINSYTRQHGYLITQPFSLLMKKETKAIM
jgi:hypothetical protein